MEGLWRPGLLPTAVQQPRAVAQAAPTLAGVRQIVETVYEQLWHTFRLDRERPHDLSGVQARVAAKMALQNFCMWCNGQLGRPLLAFTDLVDW